MKTRTNFLGAAGVGVLLAALCAPSTGCGGGGASPPPGDGATGKASAAVTTGSAVPKGARIQLTMYEQPGADGGSQANGGPDGGAPDMSQPGQSVTLSPTIDPTQTTYEASFTLTVGPSYCAVGSLFDASGALLGSGFSCFDFATSTFVQVQVMIEWSGAQGVAQTTIGVDNVQTPAVLAPATIFPDGTGALPPSTLDVQLVANDPTCGFVGPTAPVEDSPDGFYKIIYTPSFLGAINAGASGPTGMSVQVQAMSTSGVITPDVIPLSFPAIVQCAGGQPTTVSVPTVLTVDPTATN